MATASQDQDCFGWWTRGIESLNSIGELPVKRPDRRLSSVRTGRVRDVGDHAAAPVLLDSRSSGHGSEGVTPASQENVR